jgi:thioredoxin 1
MRNVWKIAIAVLLVVAVAVVILLKQADKVPLSEPSLQPMPATQAAAIPATADVAEVQRPIDSVVGPLPEAAQPASATANQATNPIKLLPRLVDLGADKCVPCKMMEPVLEALRREYSGRIRVEFYDVWKNPQIGQQYGIRLIPTQIFFDAGGNELFRHEGFMSREDILAKWKELGLDLQGGGK